MYWQIARRKVSLDRPLVMGILNVTPDSFSDDGEFVSVDKALQRIQTMIGEGADIVDIGGESTRPGGKRVAADEEARRVISVIEAIAKRFDTPVSIDTTKSIVARQAIDAGAEIINDISGLRFDEKIAMVAAEYKAGLVLMHSRGSFETMHTEPAVQDIIEDVITDLKRSTSLAFSCGVAEDHIVIDVGIGFGKTLEQNLELLVKLKEIADAFPRFPVLTGTSRKSFIGKLSGGGLPSQRIGGSIATALIAVQNGAKIVRVHDVAATVQALSVADAIWRAK